MDNNLNNNNNNPLGNVFKRRCLEGGQREDAEVPSTSSSSLQFQHLAAAARAVQQNNGKSLLAT